jgi:DNA-binding NtrC family response regulator
LQSDPTPSTIGAVPEATVLLIDDDMAVRASVRNILRARGYAVREAATCESATTAFQFRRPDVVLVDYRLPDGDGVNLIKQFRTADPEVPCVMLTGYGSIDLAVEAVREGAEQFIMKPVCEEALERVLARILEHQVGRRRTLLQQAREAREDVDPFLGESSAIRELAREARRIVDADTPILLQGETGSGKGVIARGLHRHGSRKGHQFVDLNCAGLSSQFLESELFGHERGAYTGAHADKLGLLEIAHRGILFLDEIGDMDPSIQPKLLKVLEEKRFRRLGDVREREVSVRLVAATHHDLRQLVAEGRFRRDLYFRVGALPLRVPPLRERAEDIPMLAEALVHRIGAELGRPSVQLSPAALAALVDWPWPGNVRELKNVLERAMLLVDGNTIGPRALRLHNDERTTPASAVDDLTLAEVERRHITKVFDQEGGNVQRAADRLGIPRSTLYLKLAKLGLMSTGQRRRRTGSEPRD